MERRLFNNKTECCGCEACQNICPKKIIEMKSDEEGFYYPYVVDSSKCINCNLCEKVCPLKHINKSAKFEEISYAGFYENLEDVKKSASGGAATSLAQNFIKNNGVVYGVSYTNDNLSCIEFKKATKLNELESFRGSKYAQARKKNIFKSIREDLKNKKVLFIGLPCEVNALYLFLGQKNPNLFTCSLICHGPTSPLVHKEYIEWLIKQTNKSIKEFTLRYKKEGWKPYYIKAKFSDDSLFTEKFSKSLYGRCFKFLKRPSCNCCKIKREYSQSDVTIGDYHNASVNNMKLFNSFGVSSLIVHSEQGKKLVEELDDFYIEEISIDSARKNVAYNHCIKKLGNREEFGKVISTGGIEEACKLKSCERIEKKEIFNRKVLMILVKIKRFILQIKK